MSWFPSWDGQMKDMPDLGRCCNCGVTGKNKAGDPLVVNINFLSFRAPKEGTGWGCVVCGMPPNGAIVVLCDACQEVFQATAKDMKSPEEGVLSVCFGWPDEDVRLAWEGFEKVPFNHDDEEHIQIHERRFLFPAHTLN